MFRVDRIDNAYLLSYETQTGVGTKSYPTAKKLVSGVREILGLPVQGRPKGAVKLEGKEEKEVYNGLDNPE